MSVNITFDGQPHIVAETGEVGWGGNTTSYLVAIAAGCLQKTGGNFTLSAETDFGASFGLASIVYKSRTADIADAGILRLANNSDSVSWRNAANDADLALAVNASNQIIFNGVPLATSSGGTVNLGTQFQLGHYAANGTEISGLALITASRALASDANGLPVASVTTAAELGFLSGVSSAIQTQLNTKASIGQLKILQIITANSSTDFTTSSSTFQTTNLSATITPSSTSSTILIFINGALVSDDLTTAAVIATLFRGSTDLMTGGNGGFVSLFGPGLATSPVGIGVGTCFKDSPASTSALTYAVKIKNDDNTTQVRFGNARLTTIVLMEVNGL